MCVVAIDAGHFPACINGGAQGYREGTAMMALAKMLFDQLGAYDHVTPLLTRTDADDENPHNNVPIDERAKRAARAGAFALFSLHTNAGGGNGTEVYHSVHEPSDQAIAASLSEQIAATLGIRSRGARIRVQAESPTTDHYGIIRASWELGIPHTFIIEHAFHDDLEEEALLLNRDNLAALAKLEATQIAAWLSSVSRCTPA